MDACMTLHVCLCAGMCGCKCGDEHVCMSSLSASMESHWRLAVLALAPLAVMRSDAGAPAVLAPASLAVMRADAGAPQFLQSLLMRLRWCQPGTRHCQQIPAPLLPIASVIISVRVLVVLVVVVGPVIVICPFWDRRRSWRLGGGSWKRGDRPVQGHYSRSPLTLCR